MGEGLYKAVLKQSILHPRCEGVAFVNQNINEPTFLNPTGRKATFIGYSDKGHRSGLRRKYLEIVDHDDIEFGEEVSLDEYHEMMAEFEKESE